MVLTSAGSSIESLLRAPRVSLATRSKLFSMWQVHPRQVVVLLHSAPSTYVFGLSRTISAPSGPYFSSLGGRESLQARRANREIYHLSSAPCGESDAQDSPSPSSERAPALYPTECVHHRGSCDPAFPQ